MIIIDFSQISIASFMAQPNAELSEGFLRHMILNSIRMYNKKYKNEYGQMVIACDGAQSWRKRVFPQYKAHRKKAREESSMDWELFFTYLNTIREEIQANFPYKFVHIQGVEADDVIGTLVEETQEFGKAEPVMIISSDGDFIQLQKYKNVKQFSPIQKKLVANANPHLYLFEHIVRGDKGDGIPNILSGDNAIVDGIRQSPVTQKKLDVWLSKAEDLKSVMDETTYRNFQRNQQLIDLSKIPQDIKTQIINTYESQEVAPRARILDYLIKKRCNLLVESVSEF
jgi:5'-3' exonuclease